MNSTSILPAGALLVATLLVWPAVSFAQSTTQQKPAAPARPAAPAQSAAKPATAAKPAATKPTARPAAPARPTAAAAARPAKPAAPAQATPAAVQPVADNEPKLLGQYGEWGAYTAMPNGKKLCFALAKPGSSQTSPPNRPRDPAYLFVSTRPADKVKDGISLIIGYPLKANSEVVAAVGSSKFPLYTQEDGAWVKDSREEAEMIEAMRKGAEVVIRGESSRGTKTTDTFSLKGISQALDKIAQECK
jgi:hypothetical protein